MILLTLSLLRPAWGEDPLPVAIAAIDEGEVAHGCSVIAEHAEPTHWDRVGAAWCTVLGAPGFGDSDARAAAEADPLERALVTGLLARYAPRSTRSVAALPDLKQAAATGDAFATEALARTLEDNGDIWGARALRLRVPTSAVEAPLRWADERHALRLKMQAALGVLDVALARFARDQSPAPVRLPDPAPTQDELSRAAAAGIALALKRDSTTRLSAPKLGRPEVLVWGAGMATAACATRDVCTPFEAALAWLDVTEVLGRPDVTPFAAAAVLELAGRIDPNAVHARAEAWSRATTVRQNEGGALALDFIAARAHFDAGEIVRGMDAYNSVVRRLGSDPDRLICAGVVTTVAAAMRRAGSEADASKALSVGNGCLRAVTEAGLQAWLLGRPDGVVWFTWVMRMEGRLQLLQREGVR